LIQEFILNAQDHERVTSAVDDDARLLRDCGLMDYRFYDLKSRVMMRCVPATHTLAYHSIIPTKKTRNMFPYRAHAYACM